MGIIIAMLLSGAIFFLTFVNLFPSSNPIGEAQNAVNAYINALNNYNATAAWNLMSPDMQASFGTIQNFTDCYVSQLQQSGWHAQLLRTNFVYGTIAVYSLIPLQNSCQVAADIEIAWNNSASTTRTFTFSLKTYAYDDFQPSDWKIDNRFTGF